MRDYDYQIVEQLLNSHLFDREVESSLRRILTKLKKTTYSNIEFSTWLSDKMFDNELSPAKLSKISGISENVIRRYRDGKTDPSFTFANTLINALGYEIKIERRNNAK